MFESAVILNQKSSTSKSQTFFNYNVSGGKSSSRSFLVRKWILIVEYRIYI